MNNLFACKFLIMSFLALNCLSIEASVLARLVRPGIGRSTAVRTVQKQKFQVRKSSTKAEQSSGEQGDGGSCGAGIIAGFGSTALFSSMVFAYNIIDDSDTHDALKLARTGAAGCSVTASPLAAALCGGLPGFLAYTCVLGLATGGYAVYKDSDKYKTEFMKFYHSKIKPTK